MAEGSHQPVLDGWNKHRGHRNDHEWNGEQRTELNLSAQVVDFLRSHFTFLLFAAQTSLFFQYLVACFADGGLQLSSADARQEGHAGAFGGKVHARIQHTVHLLQGAFNATHATRASHPLYAEFQVTDQGFIPDFFHLVHQYLRGGDRWVVGDSGAFGSEIDAGRFDPRYFREAALDPSHATGAGHALHTKFNGCTHVFLLSPQGGRKRGQHRPGRGDSQGET